MRTLNVRSPHLLNFGEFGPNQKGVRVVLQIYEKGQTPPITGQKGFYQLTKLNPTTTTVDIQFNMSPYIYEYIKNIEPYNPSINTGTSPNWTVDGGEEDSSKWVYVNFTKYWLDDTTWTVIGSTITWIGLDGYNSYQDGSAPGNNDVLQMLSDSNLSRTHEIVKSTYNQNNYIDFLCDITLGQRVEATYTSGSYTRTLTILSSTDASGQYMKKIPLSLYPEDTSLGGDVTLTVTLFNAAPSAGVPIMSKTIKTTHVDECKYRPVTCYWINKFGGWETLIFFKAKSESIKVKSTEYRLNQKDSFYNVSIGQYRSMNANGRKSIKLNTGWVVEDIGILLQDLLMAETVLIADETTDFRRPVNVKTDSLDIKTHINNRTINYEIQFEYSYDQINNVI